MKNNNPIKKINTQIKYECTIGDSDCNFCTFALSTYVDDVFMKVADKVSSSLCDILYRRLSNFVFNKWKSNRKIYSEIGKS